MMAELQLREFDGPPRQPDPRFVRSLFGWLAPRYNRSVALYSLAQDWRWKHELVRGLPLRSGDRGLDLACGTGLLYDRLAARLGAGRVVGLDVNRTMLRAGDPTPGRRVVQADAHRLPFRSGSFDVATAGYLLKYVEIDHLARELARVLRPGGRFGGYDFSSPIPDRLTGQGYAWYLHHALPWLGRHHSHDPGWSTLFDFLAGVAVGSGWERRVQSAFARAGFTNVRLRPSLGGAVTWVWAERARTPSHGARG